MLRAQWWPTDSHRNLILQWILKKFEITGDEFGLEDPRLLHGKTYDPQEFPDRVTMKQYDNDDFQLSVRTKNQDFQKHEYRWTNASGRCLDPKFYNKVLRLSPFKLNLIVKQSRHAFARKHIHRYLVSIKLIRFRIFQQLIDSLVLYAICSSFIIILLLKLR